MYYSASTELIEANTVVTTNFFGDKAEIKIRKSKEDIITFCSKSE